MTGVVTDGPLLEVRDIHVRFRGRQGAVARAVDGVDLDIRPGEVLALVGESGCGKTTLARTILGLEKPAEGEVRFRGEALDYSTRALVGESGCGKTTLARTILGLEKPAEGEVRFRGEPLDYSTRALRRYRRAVQLILQDPTAALNPRQTIYEAVAEGLRIQGESAVEEQRVAAALSRSGLRPPERFFTLYPYEVSGGQRQRVVIAGAMVLEPELLVADEPVSSLDASVRGEILQLMLGLVRETGIAILVVTHDLGLAWNIADRVAVMYLGRIVEQGPTEELLSAPRHPYTRALLSVVPEVERLEQQILHGETPDPTRIPEGCRFHPRCPLVQSGEAARLGIEERCKAEDPVALVPVPDTAQGSGHVAACHAVR